MLIVFFNIQKNLEDFQLLHIEPFDNRITKRDFTKLYHQQGAQLSQSDQNIDFFSVKNTIIIK